MRLILPLLTLLLCSCGQERHHPKTSVAGLKFTTTYLIDPEPPKLTFHILYYDELSWFGTMDGADTQMTVTVNLQEAKQLGIPEQLFIYCLIHFLDSAKPIEITLATPCKA